MTHNRKIVVDGHAYYYWRLTDEVARAFDAVMACRHHYMPITGDDQRTIYVCRFCGDETRLAEETERRAEQWLTNL